MRILVTGHLGYIGTVLIPMLLANGYDAAGLDTDYFSGCTFSGKIAEIDSIKMDIRDVQVSDLKGFHAVIHLAGLSNDPLSNLNPELTFEINYKATIRFAKLSKEAGVRRFVFSSSCSNYGDAGKNLINEDAKLEGVMPYGESKILAERNLSKLADTAFSPTFLRSATAYGLSPRLRFDLVINNLVAWATTTGRVYLKSDGSAWRPVVHVEDICSAFIAVLNAPIEFIHNKAFNVGITGENYKVLQLAEIVRDTVPGSRIVFNKNAQRPQRCYRVDCDRMATRLPEFKPRWNAVKGAKQLYKACKLFGLTIEDFEGRRFKRIDHLNGLIQDDKLDSSLRWKA